MAEIMRMPKLSDTMTEGVIAVWHKKVGDKVKSGELLAEVDSDKATMDVESYNEGTILYLGAKEKEPIQVEGIMAIIGKEGEDYASLLKNANGKSEVSSTSVTETPAPPDNKLNGIQNPPQAVSPKADVSSIKAKVIRMPKMSDTMTEGTIEKWHKKIGDKVKSGELMADVTTDKATMELESYEDGTLLYIGVDEGKSILVDAILAIVGEPGTDYKPLLEAGTTNGKPLEKVQEDLSGKIASPHENGKNDSQDHQSDSRIKASPLAKKIASEKGIDISQVKGSAEGGRIVKKDIESYSPDNTAKPSEKIASKPLLVSTGQESYDEIPVSSMRKVIAKRLSESIFTAPHYSLTMEINMDKSIEARKSINEFAEAKVSFNDIVIKAVSAAIKKHPKVNGSWLGDKIRYNHHIHIGVAVAVEEGLLVPVVRFADSKSLTQISAEVKELGGKAKAGKLQPSDWAGNTFTISNLGMFGIEEFTSIINQPDSCILSVGAIKQAAIVKEGKIEIGNIMKITLSCDHRVVDGATGSAFLVTLKGLLEDPIRILA